MSRRPKVRISFVPEGDDGHWRVHIHPAWDGCLELGTIGQMPLKADHPTHVSIRRSNQGTPPLWLPEQAELRLPFEGLLRLTIPGLAPACHWTRTFALAPFPLSLAPAARLPAARLPAPPVLHMVARDVWRQDAVGNFALDLQDLLRRHGHEVRLYAEHYDPALEGTIRHVDELFDLARPDDLLLFHYSTFDPSLPELLTLPLRRLVYFHNITPAEFFAPWDADANRVVGMGLAQMPLMQGFHAALANSRVSAAQLRSVLAPGCPLAVCPPSLEIPSPAVVMPEHLPPQLRGRRLLLTVGRLAPNKGHFTLLTLFEAIRRQDPSMELVIIGGDSTPAYAQAVRDRAADLGSAVHFLGKVPQEQLEACYHAATAVILTSEHEGFCVPILEALAHDRPLFLGPEPAMAETAGDAATHLTGQDADGWAAQILAGLDPALGRAARRQRLSELTQAASGSIILTMIQQVLA